MRPSGLTGRDGVERLPWGAHLCHFFHDRADLLSLLVPYFKAGLEHNEYCMWITASPVRQSDAFNALSETIPQIEQYLRSGQLEILDYRNWYLRDGRLDAERLLEAWRSKSAHAQKRGFDGARVSGNPIWLETRTEWDSFMQYEALVDQGLTDSRVIAICSYHMEKCSAQDVIDVLSNHRSTVFPSSQGWELAPGGTIHKAG